MGKIVGCLMMGAFGDISAIQTSLIIGLLWAQIFYPENFTPLALEARKNRYYVLLSQTLHHIGLRRAGAGWGP